MNVVSQINIYPANKVNVNVTCMHQQQVECRTGKVCRSKINVLPLYHATNRCVLDISLYDNSLFYVKIYYNSLFYVRCSEHVGKLFFTEIPTRKMIHQYISM